jgi:nucleoside-diphosphate-sugar epimerase
MGSSESSRDQGAVGARGEWIASIDEPVLVTGAAGFVGSRVVKTLLDFGFTTVRCLVRPSSDLVKLQRAIEGDQASRPAVELVQGNLLVREDCARAAEGVSIIFHLAAGVEKTFAGCFMNSVLTTRNLLEAARPAGELKRFVNVSSFAVYSTLQARRGSLLDETAPLEDQPALRDDPYGYAKLKQEQLVESYSREFGIPYVNLRPGAVYGPGKAGVSGRVGIDTFGVFLHLGRSNRIPLTYVDNCAEAIVLAGLTRGVDGQTFNVVDDELPTSRTFLRHYKRAVGGFRSIPVPYPIAYFFSACWEDYASWTSGQLPARFNRRRCAAEWKAHRYSNRKLKELVGWRPSVTLERAIELTFKAPGQGH